MRFVERRDKLLGSSKVASARQATARLVYQLAWDELRRGPVGTYGGQPYAALRNSKVRGEFCAEVKSLFRDVYGKQYGSVTLFIVLNVVVPIVVKLLVQWLLSDPDAVRELEGGQAIQDGGSGQGTGQVAEGEGQGEGVVRRGRRRGVYSELRSLCARESECQTQTGQAGQVPDGPGTGTPEKDSGDNLENMESDS